MSAPRQRRTITYTDESGRIYTHTQTWPGSHSPGSVPREARMVDVLDRAGHLIAVLVRADGGAPPLVYVHGQGAPQPMLALLDTGLAAVMTYTTDDGEPRAGTIGTARESFEIGCPECNVGLPLVADELSRKAEEETRPGRVARLIV